MEFKVADKKDVPSLKEMWKDVFNDDDGYIDLFFEYKMKPEYTFIAVENGEIAGAVYSVYSPLVYENGETLPALYMCGICTKPKYRGKNVAGTLIKNCLEFAKSKDIALCYLIPANPGLFDFYKKFGFENFTYIDKVEEITGGGEIPTLKTGYGNELLCHYENYALPFKPQRSEKEFRYISECYSEILRCDEGYAVLDEDEAFVYLMEQTFDSSEYVKKYAGNKNKRLIVYKPTDSKGTPFSVVKKLNDNVEIPDGGYINLMLN